MVKQLLLSLTQLLRWLYFDNSANDPNGYIKDTKVFYISQIFVYIVIIHFSSLPHKVFNNSYDFIVIGAGSSGAVIANRLTEIHDWSVLLLEAGDDESLMGQIPSLAANLQKTDYDWQFETTVQSSGACGAMVNKR